MADIQIDVPKEEIEKFCRKWQVTEMALFGSVLRHEFRAQSDIDILVQFADEVHWSLFDLSEMQRELQTIFGRDVDLLTRRGVEASRNPQRREAILSSAEVVYAE